jgi:hypothetical protein
LTIESRGLRVKSEKHIDPPDKPTNNRYHPKGADMDFEENLFVTILMVVLFVAGVGICHGIGLGSMWLRDRRSGKKRIYAVRKVL